MQRLPAWLVPACFCVGGLVMAHHPMMKDGLGWIQFDPGDTRFLNYCLEHIYQWLSGNPVHAQFWSPPYFFPTDGHFAWSETMIGGFPLYAPWRVLGLPPDTAFQFWVFSLGTLNFVSTYFFLRRCIQLDPIASSVGAVLFAFAGMRINQTMHYQLFPQFFSLWAIHACWRLAVNGPQLTERQRMAWLTAGFLAIAGQLLAGIYLGWFLVFGLSVALGIGLVFQDGRARVWFVLKNHPFTIALLSVVCLTMLMPLGRHYLQTEQIFGGRTFEEALSMTPQLRASLHFGPYSWWYAWLEKYPMFRTIPMSHEQRIGIGFVTLTLTVCGVWMTWKDRQLRYLAIVTLVLFLCTVLWGEYGPGFTLWKTIWAYFPGAKAIRGVARFALFYLIGIALFAAVAVDALRRRSTGWKWLGAALGLAAIIEQGETTPAFSKEGARADIEDIANGVGPDCEAFLFSPVDAYGPYWKYQMDAMMAQLRRGLPTLNGYSGQSPPGWGLTDTSIRSPQDEQRVAQAAQQWMNQNQITKKVCWAKVGLQEGPLRAQFVTQNVPAKLTVGQRAPAVLKFKNIGERAWTQEQKFFLGSQGPRDNTTWSSNRVNIPRTINPGEDMEVSFEFVAPSAPGTYTFQWRMVQEFVTWFGSMSPPVQIEVVAQQ